MTMRYAAIHKMNVSDGPGIGVSLYTQGCPLHCKGCFNQETWEYAGGKRFGRDEMEAILDALKPQWITRLSILGGEPLLPRNYNDIALLTYLATEENRPIKPDFKVWLWTGRLYEDVLEEAKDNYMLGNILSRIDYLVDGPFQEDKKDLTLKYRGSSNQRVIPLNGNKEII